MLLSTLSTTMTVLMLPSAPPGPAGQPPTMSLVIPARCPHVTDVEDVPTSMSFKRRTI